MGLLTNETNRNKVVGFLMKYDNKLSMLMYLVGLIWFLALAYQPFNAGTYFSENALLPGLVESELPPVLKSINHYRNLVKEAQNKDKRKTIQDWIITQFQDLGLDVYQQNFSVIYPFQSVSQKHVKGQNVYAILRARRTASTEAVVYSVPLRPAAAKGNSPTGGGVALALALAKEFRTKPYWAKDIIFLFTDYDEIGPLAWLDAYHQTTSQFVVYQDLPGRSGSIQGALNVELPLEKVSYFAVKMEGLNGQLANLDLVNLIVKLVRRQGARISIHESEDDKPASLYHDPTGESFEEFMMALKTMLRCMWHQASGSPSGNHGLFHRYHIEAVTLKGVRGKKGTNRHDLNLSARIIEGIFRSLNNLLENFHQSFFFYLLPGPTRYVSIGMYMPPFGLMVAAGLIKGISLWLATGTSKNDDLNKKKQAGDKDSSADKGKEGEDDNNAVSSATDEEQAKVKADDNETHANTCNEETGSGAGEEDLLDDELDSTPNTGIMSVAPIIFLSVLLGAMAYQGPEFLTRIMPRFRLQTEDMVLYSILAIFTAAVMYPKLMIRKTTSQHLVFDWQLLKSLALIGQSLALASVSIFNISQAFCLAIVYVPVTLLVRPSTSRVVNFLHLLMLALICPLSLMFYVGLFSAWSGELSTLDWLVQGFVIMKERIFLGVIDNYMFNSWTVATLSAIVFPIWLLFWAIPWAKV